MTEPAITFGYWNTVVLYRKSSIQNSSILCKATNMNAQRTYNMVITTGSFHNFMMKKIKSRNFHL